MRPKPCATGQLRHDAAELLGQQGEDALAGAGDDVRGDEFAQALDAGVGGIDGGAHGGDAALDDDGMLRFKACFRCATLRLLRRI